MDRETPPTTGSHDRPKAWTRAGETPPIDVLFTVLADDRCRLILPYLLREDRSVTLSELASHVSRQEPDGAAEESQRRVTTELHHNQLPKLIGAQLATYDADENTVSATESAATAQPFLDLAAHYSGS